MKKYGYMITSILMILSLSACAPKPNQNTLNNQDTAEPTPYAVYETFTLYFPNSNESALIKEQHELRISDDISREKLIIDTLKMGPKSNEGYSPLSPTASILLIETTNELCTIDFSENFLNQTDDSNEVDNLMLHAIVQSLCELETIQQVKINIDGNTTAKIGDIDLSQPLSPKQQDV